MGPLSRRVRCQGTGDFVSLAISYGDPILLPDTQAWLQRSPVASPLLNAVRNRNTRDTVRSAIERLTGGAISAPIGTPAADPKP